MAVEIGKIELKGIIRRRKKLFICTGSIIFILCLMVAFVLPPIYQSQATIVVENQEIPSEYVKSTITTYVSERLYILTEKIKNYSKLLDIIQANDLYPDLRSDGEKVAEMKDSIKLKTIDVALKESGGRERATIAFTLSYEYLNAKNAQVVVSTLSKIFVEEDQKAREAQASTTTQFLEKELKELRRQIKINEEKISRFKAKNINQLPGSTGIFNQTIFRLEQDMDNIDTRIRTIQEKIVYLKSQIANIDPLVPIITETGKVASNPNNRLKFLRLELIRKQANLSEKHPDIIGLKSEIAKLEAQTGDYDSTKEQANRLKVVNKQIAELKAKYGEKHPDIVRLSKEADLLRSQIAAAERANNVDNEMTDNPGYMNIKAQIIVSETEVQALNKERAKIAAKLEDYQQRLERMPFVDEEYNSLTLDYANTKQKFNEVANKLHSARIAQEMDMSERGVRFRIDSPANLPLKPVKPNRIMIVLTGIVLGCGFGILLAALSEGLDSSVKANEELENLAGVPVLATVSFVDSPRQKRVRRIKFLILTAAAMIILLITSLVINWFVVPMDQIWSKFEDRLVEIGVPIEKNAKEI